MANKSSFPGFSFLISGMKFQLWLTLIYLHGIFARKGLKFVLMDAEKVLAVVEKLNSLYYPDESCTLAVQDILHYNDSDYHNIDA